MIDRERKYWLFIHIFRPLTKKNAYRDEKYFAPLILMRQISDDK